MELRDYQVRCIERVRESMRRHRSVALVLPTGAGKTVTAGSMVSTAVAKGNRVWFICHRQELLDQTAGTFEEMGLRYSFIAAGRPYVRSAPVQVCSIDTLKNRVENERRHPTPALAIWDECHHIRAKGWEDTFKTLTGRGVRHIGLTATPLRLDGRGLGLLFEDLVVGPTVVELMARGHLADFRCFCPPGVDRARLRSRAGDFRTEDAEREARAIVGNLPDHYAKHARGAKALAFGVTKEHSREIAASFNAAGIRAAHLDGDTPKAQRRATLRAFARGEYDVISNVGLFGEGFDIRANSGGMDVTVNAVLSARPTQSLSLWLQQCGRALRPQPQPAIILDHAGNAAAHGLPDQVREWSLDAVDPAEDHEAQSKIKICKSCFAAIPISASVCPFCGAPVIVDKREIKERDGDLEEVREIFTGSKAELMDLVQRAIDKGYANPYSWACEQYTRRVAEHRRVK